MAYTNNSQSLAANFGVTLVAVDAVITGFEVNLGDVVGPATGTLMSFALTGFTGGNIYSSEVLVAPNQTLDFLELVSKTGMKNVYVPGSIRFLYSILAGNPPSGNVTINMEYWTP